MMILDGLTLIHMKRHVMSNKLFFRILLSLTILCLFVSSTWADVIKIKDGGRIEGIIQQEGDGKVVVEIKYGKITFAEDVIESISRVSKEKNDALRRKWEEEKKKAKKSRERAYERMAKKSAKKSAAKDTVKIHRKTPVKTAKVRQQKPKRRPGAISIIRCDDNFHSYAVCLPSDYEERGRRPVLFCFDPGGDGTTAVRKFAFAAEKYGWIVVGSLNAKNGPWEPILKAQSAMLKDVKKRYNTDQRKYYAAGFSGGARMSYTMAYKNPSNFKGVIACGAGFGQGSISKKVAVYHCVGKRDSNLDEVKKAHNTLKRKRAASKLNIFPGGHSYPPDNVLREAVKWIASQ